VFLGGVEIKALAFGTLSWGVAYSNYPAISRPDEDSIRALISEALSIGAGSAGGDKAPTLFDTADTYSPHPPGDEGFLERLLERLLAGNPGAVVATKGGMARRGPASTDWSPLDSASGFNVASFNALVQGSAARLPTTGLLWQVHHARPPSSFSQILAVAHSAIQQQQQQGGGGALPFRSLGACNVATAADLRQILSSLPAGLALASVQNRFSPLLGPTPRHREQEILDLCEERGIVYFAYGIFGGFDARKGKSSLSSLAGFTALSAAGRRHGVSAYAVVVAWLRRRWPRCCVPLVGARSTTHVRDLGAALAVAGALSEEEVRGIGRALGMN
jgi:aryl-alcohol dehydrogenase-like predicted oxidoreductase